MKRIRSVINGVLGGIMIGIGGTALLSCENRYLGAFLFSFGLFMIVTHKFGLYTGKVSYVPHNFNKEFMTETVLFLLGNIIGTFCMALAVNMTRIGHTVGANATGLMERKLADGLPSAFILAVLCGIHVYLAVETHRVCSEKGSHFGAVMGVFLSIGIFIICGFNHSIADMYYTFVSKSSGAFAYLCVVVLGNTVGGMLIPILRVSKLLPQ